MSHLMSQVCLTCHKVYGRVPCLPEQDGRETHGYCPTCYPSARAKLFAELEAMTSREIRPDSFPADRTQPGSFPMNSATATAPGQPGMLSRKVTEITGLSERRLEDLHPEDFGSPGHFKFNSGPGGGLIYTQKGLLALAEALQAAGYVAEGSALSEEARALEPVAQATPTRRRPQHPPRSHAADPVRSRLLDWEANQS